MKIITVKLKDGRSQKVKAHPVEQSIIPYELVIHKSVETALDMKDAPMFGRFVVSECSTGGRLYHDKGSQKQIKSDFLEILKNEYTNSEGKLVKNKMLFIKAIEKNKALNKIVSVKQKSLF